MFALNEHVSYYFLQGNGLSCKFRNKGSLGVRIHHLGGGSSAGHCVDGYGGGKKQ